MAIDKAISCRPCFQAASVDISPAALTQVIAEKDNPAILGGNASVEGFSIFAAEPLEIFEFTLAEDAPFEKLAAFLSKYTLAADCANDMRPGVFCGGWIGFFGYELGRFIERLPGQASDDLGMPVIRLAFYDKAIVYDHTSRHWELVALAFDGSPAQDKCELLNHWLREAQARRVTPPPYGDAVPMETFTANLTRTQYFEALAKTRRHILDGDVYQINFSQRFASAVHGAAVDLFHWQNQYNPSPCAAFLSWADRAVVSASPELFLRVRGDHICTKPIKGTRPRNPLAADSAPDNRAWFNDLVGSEKDQAELAMIVDLERNDLAKLCVPGTRHVTCGRAIEAFPTVYHAVGVVEGMLASPPGPQRIVDILKAAFPGGSITGAPKIRAMQIIDALEPTARSVYTGSIGWIGLNFDLYWNIAIRTILIRADRAYIQTGGGIVADSDPQAEWDETLTKAAALLKGLAAVRQNGHKRC